MTNFISHKFLGKHLDKQGGGKSEERKAASAVYENKLVSENIKKREAKRKVWPNEAMSNVEVDGSFSGSALKYATKYYLVRS